MFLNVGDIVFEIIYESFKYLREKYFERGCTDYHFWNLYQFSAFHMATHRSWRNVLRGTCFTPQVLRGTTRVFLHVMHLMET